MISWLAKKVNCFFYFSSIIEEKGFETSKTDSGNNVKFIPYFVLEILFLILCSDSDLCLSEKLVATMPNKSL